MKRNININKSGEKNEGNIRAFRQSHSLGRSVVSMVGEVMERLRQESLLDSTLIIFMTDHGISHARGKQFLYDEGLHVPLILSGPGIALGVRREDLVEHIDLAAISLQAAGIPLPANMQGRPVMDPTYTPRQWAFGARDRCDETVDHIRSVRSQRFKYIRNFYTFSKFFSLTPL